MFTRSKLVLISALFAILMLTTGNPAYAQAIQHGGTLHLALPNTIDNFSQFLTSSYQAWYFNQMVYPDLGIPLSTGLMHVGLSGYWSNDQATSWFFMVRPGMTWSDGVPVTASDLAYSIKLMFSSYSWGAGSLSLYSSYLAGSVDSSIKTYNSSVVEVDLNQPFGTLGDIVGAENTPNLVPQHVWNSYITSSAAPGPNFGTLVGCGAYYVSNFAQGDSQVVLLPNSYGSPFGGDAKGIPYMDKIIVLLVPTTADLSLMLKGGQIDAAPVSPSDVAGLTSDPRFKATYGATPDTWNLEYPIWNYPYNMSDFRKALAFAIDKKDLVQTALAGYGSVSNSGYIPWENSPEFNSNVPQYDYNTQTAVQLLGSLPGWTKGSDGFWRLPDGTTFTPTIYAPAENQPIVTAGNRIVNYLRAAGINAQIQSIALTSMVQIWDKGTNMFFHEQNYGYPNSELLFDYSFRGFGTGPPLNQPVFWPTSVGAAYNQTLKQLNAEGTASGRAQLMQKLQGMVADNLPSITLFYVDSVWVYNTASFGGWPSPPSTLDWPGGEFNMTALASVYTLSAQTSTTSATAPPSGMGMTSYLIGGLVVLIVIAAGVYYARSRRAPSDSP